jgi:hypothetical protein
MHLDYPPTPEAAQLPPTLREAAGWLWDQQDRLNTASIRLPMNLDVRSHIPMGTVKIGLGHDQDLADAAILNYRLDLINALARLLDHRRWKLAAPAAWGVERFSLVAPGAADGPGTRQGELTALTDVAAVLVSLIHVLGFPRDLFMDIFSDPQHWTRSRTVDPTSPAVGYAIAKVASGLMAPPKEVLVLMAGLLKLWQAAEVSWEEATRFYAEKIEGESRRQSETLVMA